jgi:hypothetical protein
MNASLPNTVHGCSRLFPHWEREDVAGNFASPHIPLLRSGPVSIASAQPGILPIFLGLTKVCDNEQAMDLLRGPILFIVNNEPPAETARAPEVRGKKRPHHKSRRGCLACKRRRVKVSQSACLSKLPWLQCSFS